MKALWREKIFLLSMIICLSLAAISAFGQASGGSIAGILSDQSGKPIIGAFVTALKNTLPPASGRAVSTANGEFLISTLPAGSYSLCVQLVGSDLLDPCEWELDPAITVVQPSQPTTGVQLKVKRGAVIPIRLNDPQKLLETPSSAGTTPDVLIAVRTPRGLPHPAALASKDAGGRNLTVTVPLDTALKLTLFSPHATITNASGGALAAAGSELPITQPSGAAPVSLTFNVTGLH